MLICLGDIHFNDSRPWSVKTGYTFINWIKKWDKNNENNHLILLGDLTESAFLSGIVIEMLMQFFSCLKFKTVTIIKGNHDTKLSRSGSYGLTYSFLKNKDFKGFENIKVADTLRVESIDNINVVMLPHITTDKGHSLRDYESLTESIYFNNDLLVGHFADTSLQTVPYELIDIDYLKAKHVCLGHVHSSGPHYAGSVVPNSISEVGTRYAVCYTKKGNEVVEQREALPNILDYYEVKYPELLPPTEAMIPVYTIINCRDEDVARAKYGYEVYIRKCLYDVSIDTESLHSITGSADQSRKLSVKDMFDNWVKTMKIPDNILALAKRYI